MVGVVLHVVVRVDKWVAEVSFSSGVLLKLWKFHQPFCLYASFFFFVDDFEND